MNSTVKVDKYSDEVYEILKLLGFPDASNLDDKTTIMSYTTQFKKKETLPQYKTCLINMDLRV